MTLEKYLFHNVKIVDDEDNIIEGYVDMFCSKEDSEENMESIGIIPTKDAKAGIGLFETEIKSVEII